jgi:uridine monophosphate synthetase
MSFLQRLQKRVDQAESLLCVGLDPHPEFLMEASASAAEAFCLRLIEATAGEACAFKPNAAFFEAYGGPGWEALRRVIRAVPEGIPVILDAKRGDIASTAKAYAQAAFEALDADAITLSPYLGRDSIEPFIEDREKGAFLLCKTSNPGADDLQSLIVSRDRELYRVVCRLALTLNERDNIGLVVGATDPVALAQVRADAPEMWLLAPGIGAQGGDLERALSAGLRDDGSGMIVPVSRAIAEADDPGNAAGELRSAINAQRKSHPAIQPVALAAGTLADALFEAGCVRLGEFTLKSGRKSPIYFDLRRLVSHPGLLERVARAYLPLLKPLAFDRLGALPYAALPITTAISLAGDWPFVYPRKEVKDYGTRAEVEGEFNPGETIALIDDLATTGGSKLEAIERLQAVGLRVENVVVLIDREGGAREELGRQGVEMHAVLQLRWMIDRWERLGRVSAEHCAAVRKFLASG